MKNHRFAWILPATAAVAVSVAVVRVRARVAGQSVALLAARSQNLELQRLLSENRQLESAQLSADERKLLESRHEEAQALRARLAALQAEAQNVAAGDRPSELPAKDWVYAGRDTPRDAIESVLWAASRGDVDHLANLVGFTSDVRAQAQALFSRLPAASQQEYGTPEKVVATLLAGNFPRDASAMTLLADKQWDQDAVISMSVSHSEGQSRINLYRFHHTPEGWQLLVPASVIAGYEKTLLGDPQPPESSAP